MKPIERNDMKWIRGNRVGGKVGLGMKIGTGHSDRCRRGCGKITTEPKGRGKQKPSEKQRKRKKKKEKRTRAGG